MLSRVRCWPIIKILCCRPSTDHRSGFLGATLRKTRQYSGVCACLQNFFILTNQVWRKQMSMSRRQFSMASVAALGAVGINPLAAAEPAVNRRILLASRPVGKREYREFSSRECGNTRSRRRRDSAAYPLSFIRPLYARPNECRKKLRRSSGTG